LGFYGCFERYYNDRSVAGVTRKDLEHLDMSKPLPDGMDLVAEVILLNDWFPMRTFGKEKEETDQSKTFPSILEYQFKPVKEALNARYTWKGECPRDISALRRLLARSGIDLDVMRDPWGMPYRPVFSVNRDMDILEFISAGPDKRFGTEDDFVATPAIERPYF